MTSGLRLRPHPGVISRQIRDSFIALDGRTGRYFQLDEQAASIWRALDGTHTLDTLVAVLTGARSHRAESAADIRAFVETALGNGLLTSEPEPGIPTESVPHGTAIQVRALGLHVNPQVASLREAFVRDHYVRLPLFIEPSLLNEVLAQVQLGRFAERSHGHIGHEHCLVPGNATAMLQLLFNDPALLETMAKIAGCGPLGCFDGRVYRMAPGAGHYDSWHSDAAEGRQIAVSVNLSVEPYEGGLLEIRRAAEETAERVIANPGVGSAVMFRISPDLRHRVGGVTGTNPRTAWAGWFRTAPQFADLFLDSLAKNGASG